MQDFCCKRGIHNEQNANNASANVEYLLFQHDWLLVSQPLPCVPWVSDVCSGRPHLFPVCVCVDSAQFSRSSCVCLLPDAFHSTSLSIQVPPCAANLSRARLICVWTVNIQWYLVTIPCPCAYYFQASAHKAMWRGLPALSSSSKFPTCAACWPAQPACISRVVFSQESQGFCTCTCLSSLLIAAIPSPAFLVLLESRS